jgi:hypothetical protein
MQVMDGQSPRPVTDRVARLDYTARYRKLFGGGLAHALTRLAIDPARWPPPLLFDGLRGREEVMHAADRLPKSRFIVLLASDEVRVRRLLGRGDSFDQTAVAAGGDALAALRTLPGIGSVFDAEQLGRLAALAGEGEITTERLVQQAAIVVAERRNYDPEEARRWLERLLPPERRLVIDTTEHDQEAVGDPRHDLPAAATRRAALGERQPARRGRACAGGGGDGRRHCRPGRGAAAPDDLRRDAGLDPRRHPRPSRAARRRPAGG